MQSIRLFHYWRSSCSWRVRWALALKNISYTSVTINLLNNEQNTPQYLKINPSGLVPALDIHGFVLTESLAIIEYLEESFQGPALLPQNMQDRARVREFASMLMTIQSVQNLRVMKKHSNDPKLRQIWAREVIEQGLYGVEKSLLQRAGTFSFGSQITLADLFLIPQIYNAHRFNVDMRRFANCERIYQNCLKTPACNKAAPHNQPGAINPNP